MFHAIYRVRFGWFLHSSLSSRLNLPWRFSIGLCVVYTSRAFSIWLWWEMAFITATSREKYWVHLLVALTWGVFFFCCWCFLTYLTPAMKSLCLRNKWVCKHRALRITNVIQGQSWGAGSHWKRKQKTSYGVWRSATSNETELIHQYFLLSLSMQSHSPPKLKVFYGYYRLCHSSTQE